MNTLLYIFILLPVALFCIQIGFVSKRYLAVIAPWSDGKKIEWYKSIDNLKLLLTIMFLFAPYMIIKTALATPIDNYTFRVGLFLLALIISGICLWFEVSKVGKMKGITHSKEIKTKPKVLNDTLLLELIKLKTDIAKIDQQMKYVVQHIQNAIVNRPIKKSKTGPKPFSKQIFTAIKYGLIHIFNIKQRNEDLIDSKELFYKKVAKQDGFNIKKDYTTFWNETKNLNRYFEQKKRITYVEPLLADDDIKLYPNIVKFLNDVKERINSN